MKQRASELAGRCHELVSFLVDVRGVRAVKAELAATATYHDSCSGLRELRIKRQPRDLLASVAGLDLVEMEDSEVCCGFGGTFCVKYPGDLDPDGVEQGRMHRGHGRRSAACGRSRLPDEHGRPAQAPGLGSSGRAMSPRCSPVS